MGIDVRRIGPDDWEVVRDLRLEALLDAPTAFGSTYDRERAFEQETWIQRLTSGAGNFLAYVDEIPRGMATGLLNPDHPGRAELLGMWVHPAVRRMGLGRPLVEAVAGWSKEVGANELHLWVTESNESGRRFYERLGFEYTGEREPLQSFPELDLVGMLHAL